MKILGEFFLKRVGNYNVITIKNAIKNTFGNTLKKRCNNNVITSIALRINIVITMLFFSGSIWAKTVQQDMIFLDVFSPVAQGTFVYGKTQVGTQVFYQDMPITLTSDGDFVLALPKDAPKEMELVAIKDNQKISKTYNVISRKWKEEVVNGLPPKKVSPSEDDLKRITQENQLLRRGRENTHHLSFPTCFTRPVDKKARISSEFGSSRILNGVKTAGHSGTDYALSSGSEIYAPADGVVKITHPDMFYSGKTILIDHGYGVFSSYSHLSDILVQQGDNVKQGDLIGKVGTTGRSTGPHLHLTLTWFGVRVDPEYILKTYACEGQK